MADVHITFPDNSSKKLPAGTTPMTIAQGISEGLARNVLGALLNDKPVDASRPITQDATLKLLTVKDPEGLEMLRHSCAHLLAHAIQRLYPKAQPTIGPVIEHGFYYDFDNLDIKEEELAKIEEEMKKIAKEKHEVERVEHKSKEEALKIYGKNPYKKELIEEFDENLSSYIQGDFQDLCRGPHTPSTGNFRDAGFKLDKIAGAYWRGSSDNKMLTRIYGLCFADKKELKNYLEHRAEAEARDHKKLGHEMGLYAQFSMVGKGLPIWLPRGNIIKEEIEKFAKEMEHEAGYVRVTTPHLAKKELFLTSGHLPYYEEGMYPCMKMDDGEYYLKAMNCPMHHLIFGHESRSYRDLPLRIAEYGTCYRNELSGTLNGLLRVRMLSMNDAHMYCTRDQIEQEVESVLMMIKKYYEIFGLHDYWFRLSLGEVNNKKKYIDEPENWTYSEDILRKVLVRLSLPFTEEKDEAAFYGPKIDVQFRNVYGREETMSTVQLDFAAKKRFNLTYVDKKGNKNNEVFVIHRAPLSTHERFMAFVIEHFAGKFPLWLAPEQVRIIPIADRHAAYAQDVAKKMRKAGLRIEIDEKTETVNKKVREAQLDRVNYILVVGDREMEEGTVTVRTRDEKVHGARQVDDLIADLREEYETRKLPEY